MVNTLWDTAKGDVTSVDLNTVEAQQSLSSASGSTAGFFGATPITQPVGPASAVTTTAPTSVSVGAFAFGQAQATAIVYSLNLIRTVLLNLGLMAP
jgi:hypothetical protein